MSALAGEEFLRDFYEFAEEIMLNNLRLSFSFIYIKNKRNM